MAGPRPRRNPRSVLVALAVAVPMLMTGAPAALAAPVLPAERQASAPLTNTAHLDWLLASVPLTEVAGHTTYLMDAMPSAQAPWTYADRNPDGSFRRIGGGALDPVTGHYGQGAFNSDDIARTAVVYLRHWQQTGSAASREHAFQTLRALTYLQTASGPDAGNVVLWQQADGTLNPSATPAELPDPSDSAESYWLARTVWALGEGYAQFEEVDPAFASFLQDRLHLALRSLSAQSLGRYGSFDVADGVRVPGWLVNGGADASAEAVLGLSAYVRAEPADAAAATALDRLSQGIALMSAGSTDVWPFGAILPWTASRTFWHAWGGYAPGALAGAAGVIRRPGLLEAAVTDSAQFTPQLLAAGGPDNLWGPTPGDAQIAYGVDCRLESLVATAQAANAPGLWDLAAITAGWFFGANPSGAPAYDPSTGVAIDGIEPSGAVNHNSGAESTIHTLLAMLTLDRNPVLRARALGIDRTVAIDGLSVVEAESGVLTGNGTVVTPASAWTGEALWSGGAYVALTAGDRVTIPIPASEQPLNLYPIVNLGVEQSGRTTWTAGRTRLGSTPNGGAGDQGITGAPGMLLPLTVGRALPSGASAVVGRSDGAVALDALLVQPLISSVIVTGRAGESTLFVSAADSTIVRAVPVPRGFALQQRIYDSRGRLVAGSGGRTQSARRGLVTVVAGGFTVVGLVRT